MVTKPTPLPKLKEILANLAAAELRRVAQACETTVDYLTEQVANGHRRPSVGLAKKLVRELAIFGLRLSDVRPDVYAEEKAAVR